MSIVADATATHDVFAEAVMAAVCLGVAVPLVVRWVRRAPLDGPGRLPPGGSAWPLVLAMVWGLLVWMAVPAAYVAWRGPALRSAATPPTSAPSTRPDDLPTTRELARPASPTDGTLNLASLPPRDVAFLSAVPHLAAFVALLAFDLTIFGGSLGRLGFSRRQAVSGLAGGAKLSLAFVPLVFGGAVLTDWFYQWVDYTHPREHDLLRVLGEAAEPVVRVALAAGAVVVAPLSEELLFRGHAQTILRGVLARLGGGPRGGPGRKPEGRGFPLDEPHAATADAAGGTGLGAGPNAGVDADEYAPPAWATWGAIVLASAVFASIHAPWTWPPIFLLSLCLGWAYERTGNLWVPVAIHAAFNGVSTLLFLSSASG